CSVGGLHRLDDAVLEVAEVTRIKAALKSGFTPQAESVGTFVVVRAGDQDVAVAGELFPHADHEGREEPDNVHGHQRDFLLAVAQNRSAGHDGVVDAGGTPIVANPAMNTGFFPRVGVTSTSPKPTSSGSGAAIAADAPQASTRTATRYMGP